MLTTQISRSFWKLELLGAKESCRLTHCTIECPICTRREGPLKISQMGKHCKMLAVGNKKYNKIYADHRRSHYFDVKNLKAKRRSRGPWAELWQFWGLNRSDSCHLWDCELYPFLWVARLNMTQHVSRRRQKLNVAGGNSRQHPWLYYRAVWNGSMSQHVYMPSLEMTRRLCVSPVWQEKNIVIADMLLPWAKLTEAVPAVAWVLS